MAEERLARLEAYRDTDSKAIEQLTEKADATLEVVQDIQQQLHRQKGFIAGVMFVVLPIWSFVTAVGLMYWERWTKP